MVLEGKRNEDSFEAMFIKLEVLLTQNQNLKHIRLWSIRLPEKLFVYKTWSLWKSILELAYLGCWESHISLEKQNMRLGAGYWAKRRGELKHTCRDILKQISVRVMSPMSMWGLILYYMAVMTVWIWPLNLRKLKIIWDKV